MIELFECIPLSARISKRQCEINRKRVNNMFTGEFPFTACKGCAGVGGVAVSIPVEVVDMAKTVCAVKGCEEYAQKRGMCKAHLNGSVPRKPVFKAAVVDMPVDVVDESGWVQPVMVTAPVVASADEIKNIDYIAYLRQLLDEKLEEWVKELNSAKTPRDRARYYLSMCDAAEGLGY